MMSVLGFLYSQTKQADAWTTHAGGKLDIAAGYDKLFPALD